jgi:peptidoglycan LD-endopeptidase CwlK
MAFTFGAKSRAELKGVHPDMVAFAERTLALSGQDFTVHDGLRTRAEQQRMVATGASQTLNSRHLVQADGFGHAVDLVPWINGKPRWEWAPIFVIAAAAKKAAAELGLRVKWGGCWQELSQIKGDTPGDMEKAVAAYGAARRRAGKKSFPDGPHFELVQ